MSCFNKCKDCIYFNIERLKGADSTCSELGKLAYSPACSKFLYNYRNLDLTNNVQEFFKLVHQAKNNKLLTALSCMAEQEKITRKYGLSIGDVFYVKLFRQNYISSYFKVVVICATKSCVHVQGIYNGHIWFGQMEYSSLIKASDFEQIRKNLKSKNLVRDPDFDKNFEKVKQYKPKKIEKVKRKKKEVDPLESMADEILENADSKELVIEDTRLFGPQDDDNLPDIDSDDEYDVETDDIDSDDDVPFDYDDSDTEGYYDDDE